MMHGVRHPGLSHPVWCKTLVILAPDFFILKTVKTTYFTPQIPGKRIDGAALFDVLDDNGEVRSVTHPSAQDPVYLNECSDKRIIIADITQVALTVRIVYIQFLRFAALFLVLKALLSQHVPIRWTGDAVINHRKIIFGEFCCISFDNS